MIKVETHFSLCCAFWASNKISKPAPMCEYQDWTLSAGRPCPASQPWHEFSATEPPHPPTAFKLRVGTAWASTGWRAYHRSSRIYLNTLSFARLYSRHLADMQYSRQPIVAMQLCPKGWKRLTHFWLALYIIQEFCDYHCHCWKLAEISKVSTHSL
jgi:hypothetical protein